MLATLMSVKSHTRTLFLMSADVLAVFFGILAALILRLGVDGTLDQLEERNGWTKIGVATLVWLLGLYFHDLYDYEVVSGRDEAIFRLVQSVGLSWVALAVLYYFVPALEIGAGTALYAIAITLGLLLAIRLLLQTWLDHPEFGEKILVVGDGAGFTDTVNAALVRRAAGYRIVGFLSEGDNSSAGPMIQKLGALGDLEDVVSSSKIDRIIVGMAERRGTLPIEALLRIRLGGDVIIEECSAFYERLCGRVHLDMVRPSWLIFSEYSPNTQLKSFLRDSVHRLLALIGLIVTFPLALVTALIIKMESSGPVFYRQERVGKGDQRFMLIKFRSMRVDAEADGEPVWAKAKDDRATVFGHFIRKVRIDEIPQFWNILKGEMRFVGPRPERPHFVDQLEQDISLYKYRHLVAPGLTGWAQVNYAYGASVEDARHKLEYDLYYIKNQTLVLDLLIVLRTVKIIVLGRGSR
jgi:sugar transferase (PEP-CTERM system associated)